jgi:hypothetical protein
MNQSEIVLSKVMQVHCTQEEITELEIQLKKTAEQEEKQFTK